MFRLDDHVAVVTGAVGLLGREHCRALAEAGAAVVLTDVDGEECKRLAAELQATTGVETLGWSTDVTEPASVRALANAVRERFDRIDVLVNNAAVNDGVDGREGNDGSGVFETLPLDAWRRSVEVNLTGAFTCCQVFGPAMARRGYGSIINIASTYGVVAPDPSLYRRPDGSQALFESAAYCTSKAGLLALTRYLAAYWGRRGVRVNALSPGGVHNGQEAYFVQRYSDRTPLGRMADASDYRGAVIFLASSASHYMTGANLVVDGGFTVW